MKRCRICSQPLRNKDIFCPYCGTRRSKPGDPYAGLLIYAAGVVLIALSCPLSCTCYWLLLAAVQLFQ